MRNAFKWLRVTLLGTMLATGACSIAENVEGDIVFRTDIDLVDSLIEISLQP